MGPGFEDEGGAGEDEEEADEDVPFGCFAEVDPGEEDENGEGDDFLDGFELGGGDAGLVTETIGGDLETVFEERDGPTGDDDQPERFFVELEVAVPRDGHEEVGDAQQKDGAQHG